jgi:Peptidase family U32
MQETQRFLESIGLPSQDSRQLPTSTKRFPDGAQYRFEIPSVEGPRCLKAVIEEAQRYKLTIHRISQGSGILLLTDDEIKEMLRIAKDQQMEVSLFVGPRATWDIGAQPLTPAGKNIGLGLRGMDQVVYAIEDIKRGCDLGLRGILLADLGLLWLVNEMKKASKLPANLVVKISVQLSATNPIAVKILEDFGAGTFNVSSDLPLPLLASIRQAVSIPLDFYVESPDNFGGFVRHFEIPEFIRVLSPLYVKLGLRNAPDIYPSGTHLEPTAIALTRERVRRAKIASDLIQRYCASAVMSKMGAKGLAIPEI